VVGNSCSNWGAGAGIQVRGNFNGLGTYNDLISVVGNTVLGNDLSGTFGILCIGVRGLTVSANTAKYVQLDGFYFDNIVGGTITGNVSSHNGAAGFRFGDDQNIGPSSGLTVTGNQALNNNLNGNGFAGFHVANAHGFAHKQFHFLGNYAANDLPNVTISAAVRASNVVTLTTAAPHFMVTGTYANLVVAGVTDATFNSTFSSIVVTVTDATHFTYPQTAANATSSGGTVQGKPQVNGFGSALTGGSTLDLLSLEFNSGLNLVGGLYSATMNATASPQVDTVGGTLNTNTQINSTLATGTAPLAVVSTTPVANLTLTAHPVQFNCGGTTTCANTQATSSRTVMGAVALTAGSATVTGISGFTNSSSFVCTGLDRTAVAAVKIANASASSITITGTGTDTINYICVGN
jgi:hypothetical protein